MSLPITNPSSSEVTPSAPPLEYYDRPFLIVPNKAKVPVPVPPPRSQSGAPPLPPHSVQSSEPKKPDSSPRQQTSTAQPRNNITIFAQTKIVVNKNGQSSERTRPPTQPSTQINVQSGGPPTEQQQLAIVNQSWNGLGKCCWILFIVMVIIVVASTILAICTQ